MNGQVVLVVGATGFLGSHLVDRLAGEGAVVHALARRSLAGPAGRHDAVTSWTGDIRNEGVVDQIVTQVEPDVVFHTAANTSVRLVSSPDAFAEAFETNVRGTLNVLLALARIRKSPRVVVRLGGIEEYGTGPVPSDETQREQPVSPYSASQVAATHLCRSFFLQTGLPVLTLRPAVMYGPGQSPTFFIPGLIERALDGGEFRMTAGDQTRDFVFIADVVDACLRAATTNGLEGSVINLGSGREYRIRDVADMIVRLAGGPVRLSPGAHQGRKIDLPRLALGTSTAARLLGWRATTSLEDGLARTIAHERAARARAIRNS
jgi:nucleoside-diphosphate-sugar epimerase